MLPIHPETRHYDGHGTYATSYDQARSILTIRSLFTINQTITNTCSLLCAVSLPDALGWVRVARWDGVVVIVKGTGAIIRSYDPLYPQHNYTLTKQPPVLSLYDDPSAFDVSDPEVAAAIRSIPLADHLI